MKQTATCLILTALILTGCLSQKSETPPSVSSGKTETEIFIDGIMEEYKIPGLACLVIKESEVALLEYRGNTKTGGDIPITENSRFHLGSNTKAMTALLAAISVERGELRWDSTIGEILEPAGYDVPESYKGINLELLLSHQGGIPSIPGHEDWITYFSSTDEPSLMRKQMIMDTFKLPVDFTPGERTQYSNMGIVIAGVIVAEAASSTWEELMEERIFKPLAMDHMGFGPPGKIGSDQPWGHNPMPVPPESSGADNPSGLGPAGTVHGTLESLIPYLMLWLHEGEPLISYETWEFITMERHMGFGLGWIVLNQYYGKGLAHDGSNTMFYSTFFAAPDLNSGIIVLTNSGTAGEGVSRITEYLAENYF